MFVEGWRMIALCECLRARECQLMTCQTVYQRMIQPTEIHVTAAVRVSEPMTQATLKLTCCQSIVGRSVHEYYYQLEKKNLGSGKARCSGTFLAEGRYVTGDLAEIKSRIRLL